MSNVLAFDWAAIDALPAHAEGLLKYASANLIIGIPASKNDGTGSKEVHADPRWTPKHVALVASLLSNRNDLADAPTVVQDGDEIDRQATEAAVESYLSDPARPNPLVMQDDGDTPFAERTDLQAIIDEQTTDKALATDKATIDGWVTEESLSDAEYQALIDDATDWAPNQSVNAGDERAYDGTLYRVIQAHMTQADWTPPNVPALFVEIHPVNVIGPWEQPTGAQDAYYTDGSGAGSRCTLGGHVWETQIDANTVEPGTQPAFDYWSQLT